MRRTFSLISEFIWNISISCTESSWQWVGTWKTYFQCVLVKDLISPASLHMLVAWRMWTLTQVFQGGGGERERATDTAQSFLYSPTPHPKRRGKKIRLLAPKQGPILKPQKPPCIGDSCSFCLEATSKPKEWKVCTSVTLYTINTMWNWKHRLFTLI